MKPNRLIHETSPYLLQHAYNPVHWYPWGNEALQLARTENKPILVSIGYAACHWCHVMEHESFEDTATAQMMNSLFVCIKVDREERPDIDQIYMTAVQLMTGSGGWPLNCFALPDGRPFYGGTYFRPQQWREVLQAIDNAYRNDLPRVLSAAEQIAEGIASYEVITEKTDVPRWQIDQFAAMYEAWQTNFDTLRGGHKRAPKFPLPNSLRFLLRYHHYTADTTALEHVQLTLQRMADGGIYDHVGGGFARYSVDEYWKVPHFEKMLYDNAQLISLYSEAYKQTPASKYKQVVYETIAWLQREMTSSEGGFYSSLDADSEGVEGKFYVWNRTEIDKLLGEDAAMFADYFDVTPQGNWEHGNSILLASAGETYMAKKYGLEVSAFIEKINDCKQKLLAERDLRVRPALDDKILASWNGLTLCALADAYTAFGEPAFLQLALQNANFISEKLVNRDFSLCRNYKNGKSSINAFLDDYAFVIAGFIALYQSTLDTSWLHKADKLCQYTLQHFSHSPLGMFYYTSDTDEPLVARKMEIHDNVIPASNSQMANNLFVLGTLLYNNDYMQHAEQMLANVANDVAHNLAYHSNWGMLMLHFASPPAECIVTGSNATHVAEELQQRFMPHVIIGGACTPDNSVASLQNRFDSNQTRIFVCRNRVCHTPVSTVHDALLQIENQQV